MGIFQLQYELTNDLDREHLKISEPKHVDHENPHTFEIEDLKKLIHKTSEDLAEADKKRREEFKVGTTNTKYDRFNTIDTCYIGIIFPINLSGV